VPLRFPGGLSFRRNHISRNTMPPAARDRPLADPAAGRIDLAMKVFVQ
jgi:hypothetical protein